ncbi:MAG: hypothetical protein IPI64_08920 [Chloracidobacterium sp.]|nr:hypothetical protein [Chloracidobacterium sp.]
MPQRKRIRQRHNLMKKYYPNKVAWLVMLAHAILFCIGMYQRGSNSFHFYYEPIIFKAVLVGDCLWLGFADFLGLGTIAEPFSALLFMGIGGCFQWLFVGQAIGNFIRRRRRAENQISSQQLFQFPRTWISDQRSVPLVIKGDREWIEQYISVDEFAEMFGGYATWRPPDDPTDMMRGEGLGVWGKRNISRFKRILRERGAEFDVVDGEGPKQQIWTTS